VRDETSEAPDLAGFIKAGPLALGRPTLRSPRRSHCEGDGDFDHC